MCYNIFNQYTTSVQLQEELGKFVSQALLVYWYVERFEKQKNSQEAHIHIDFVNNI